MDGTFAVIFFIVGLTDTYLGACDGGCFSRTDAPARAALHYGDVIFQDDVIASELAVSYDLGRSYGVFQPVIGASITSDDDAWVGLGAKWTTEHLIASPLFVELFFMPGLYARGDGPDLGSVLEFRGGLGVGYRFDSGASVTLLTDHRSNGDLAALNPGLETVALRFAVPLD